MTWRERLLDLRWRIFARHLAASEKPILVGPWRSEVGFELLYWLPFLLNFQQTYKISPERMIAIGRGGSAAWYGVAGQADLFERMQVEEARTWGLLSSQQTGSIKQHAPEGWEDHVCALTAKGLGLTHYHVLRPGWMYHLLAPYWEGRAPLSYLDRYCLQPVHLKAPTVPPELKLPERFIAVRWYARATWPLNEKLVLFARTTTEALAKKLPVILINSGFQADDHADMALGDLPNVFNLADLYPQSALNNLAIQSAVIAKASAYVGTYGGMAQGAMRWGVPTVAFYHEFGNTSPHHLALSQSLSLRTGTAFWAGKPGQVEPLLGVLK